MKPANHYLAVDLGAESGRVMLATCGPDGLSIEEVHRFPNGPIEQAGSLRWDFGRLTTEIKAGLKQGLVRQPEVVRHL